MEEPQIEVIENKRFNLIGTVYYGDPFHAAKEWSYDNEIGNLWNRYFQIAKKYDYILEKVSKNHSYAYEVHIETPEFKKTKHYYVFVGCEAESFFHEIPLELFMKPFPRTDYIKFRAKVIEKDEPARIFSEWLPNSDWEQSYPYIMQGYSSEHYFGMEDPRSELDWYIPVNKKSSKINHGGDE
jgi:AraC family transcriptional regulator